jgi:hypothetical protein
LRQDHAQAYDLARVLIDQAIPLEAPSKRNLFLLQQQEHFSFTLTLLVLWRNRPPSTATAFEGPLRWRMMREARMQRG